MNVIQAGRTIDNSTFGSFHFSIIFWCFFIILMDGYDVVIYGSVVPSLMEEWGISPVTAGAIGSYTAAGTAIGAVVFGLLADRLGRKRVIIVCTVIFSLFTALSAFAAGPVMFTIFRVIAGLGLGGVMPNVIALSTEYAPKKIRAAMVSFILIYAMNTWLPKLMIEAGYSLSSSLVFVAFMNVGAIVGTIVFGRLTDKWGFKKVMFPLYLLGAIALSCIGLTQNAFLAYLLIGMIGAASVGVQNISNAFVSQYYPPSMRSTGVGAAMAFGRIGGIFAPTFVGILLTMNLTPQLNFTFIASAAVLGAIAILFVQEKHAHYRNESADPAVGDSQNKAG